MPPLVVATAKTRLPGAVPVYKTSLILLPESRGTPGITGLIKARSSIQLDHGELSPLTS
jgi:hypothetical protein